jgi:hypothetical protein
MLIVLTLSTWMNNIIAAVVAFIYNGVAGIIVLLHTALVAGSLGDNALIKAVLNVAYWVVPHHLMSDAKRQLAIAEFDLFSATSQGQGQGQGGPTLADFVNSVPGASDVSDIIWWVFLVALMSGLVYMGVRRRQV